MSNLKNFKGFIILALSALVSFSSCTSNKEKLSKQIYELETSDSSSTNSGMNRLSELYFQFAKEFPKDSISEKYLYKGFMFKYLTKHWDDAISYANNYKSKYPNKESYHSINLKLADLFLKGKNQLDSSAHYYLLAENKAQFSTDEKRQAGEVLNTYGNANKKPEVLFSAAKFYQLSSEFEKSANIYAKLAESYPEFNKAPDALLAAGFIYWDHLKDNQKAASYYKLLVEKYPNHPLAKDAKTLLDEGMLTMSDDELANYLLKKNQSTQ